MYKKVISPIGYFVMMFFSVVVILVMVMFLSRISIGLTELLIPVVAFIVSTLLFWWGNRLVKNIEKLKKPKYYDHFRQSALLYLIVFVIFLKILSDGYYGGLGEAYRLSFGLLALWGIIVNAIFLLKQRILNKK